MLDAYRAAVIDEARGPALEAAIDAATGAGASVEGIGYKKVPAGFDAAHARADLLRHDALHASFDEAVPATLASPAFVDHVVARFRPLAPLLAWVAEL
jgi:hypothetical protein